MPRRRPTPNPPARRDRPARGSAGGAPLVLPPWLDALSDRWWGLTPRTRAIAVAVALVLVAAASTVRVATSPYGPPVAVLVATADLPVGATLDDAALRRARWPGELVPPGALTQASGTLTAPLPEGSALTEGHVTEGGLAGAVGVGQVAVPLPAELVPPLEVDTGVRVVASGADGAGVVLADRAEVVADDGTSLWLAVPDAAAADVAAAGLRGTVALAVIPVGAAGPAAGAEGPTPRGPG
jgi:hypothetical protein